MGLDEKKEPAVQDKPAEKGSKRFLLIYSVALFLVAGVLIAFSYASQANQEANIQQIQIRSQASLAEISAKNSDLQKNNSDLYTQIEELERQVIASERIAKCADATEYLWKLEKAIAVNDPLTKQKCIDALEKDALKDALSQAARAEYDQICAANPAE